eukprot:1174267-Prorocentrum_minimum.AAC.1
MLVDTKGNVVDTKGNAVDTKGNYVDTKVNYVDTKGKTMPISVGTGAREKPGSLAEFSSGK